MATKSFFVSVPVAFAQETVEFLSKHGLLDKKLVVKRKKTVIVFPILRKLDFEEKYLLVAIYKNFFQGSSLFESKNSAPSNLKEALQSKFSKKELSLLVSSYDSLGDIAIIEIPKALEKKEKIIGNALLKVNKSIKTVCKKTGAHKGKYRIEPVKIIAGEKNTIATYRESACVFKIPLGKAFFSPRLGTERLRIAKEIKKGEIVGAFFAGVGPFPIVFARNSQMQKAIAIELNPIAVKFMKQNSRLNKVEDKIEIFKGDVKKVVPKKYKGLFDRVVMPLPKGAENFLKETILSIKKTGGIVHFYAFVPTSDPFTVPIKKITETAKKLKRKVKILSKKRVRDFSKQTMQIVIDFFVN